MSRGVFRLPVSLLTDDVIQSGDYPDWSWTFRAMVSLGEDQQIVQELLASVPQIGVQEPLTIGVQRWDLVPYLSDGHHRAYVLHTLMISEFPYRWFWKWRGQGRRPCFETEPLPEWILEK